jgi:hypothetical protein
MMRPCTFSPIVLGALALVATAAGCHHDGCIGGDDGQCVPPAACPALVYPACAAPKLRVEQIGGGDGERVYGPKSLAAEGDYLLENDLVRVVLDAPEHPHFIGPSGGAILDLAPLVASQLVPNPGDQTNAIYHAAGVLPRDAVHYDSAAIVDPQLAPSAPGAHAAVVFRGHLESDPQVTVVTRYELRPCEPGVRVRSDLYNGASEPKTLFLADAFFWGDNGVAPFVPGPGLGFLEPDLDLEHIDQAWRQWPFLAARSQAAPDTAYAAIACDRSQSAGFNSSSLTAAGVPLDVTQPGDGFHFERFILAEPGPGLAPAVNEALRVRTSVHGDPPAVNVTGRLVANGAPVDPASGRAASLLFYEPARRRPRPHHPLERGRPLQRWLVPGGAAAQPQLPRPALRFRAAGRSRHLLRRGRRRRVDRRRDQRRVGKPEGQGRIVTGRPGRLRRAGADPVRRSRDDRRAGPLALRSVPRL